MAIDCIHLPLCPTQGQSPDARYECLRATKETAVVTFCYAVRLGTTPPAGISNACDIPNAKTRMTFKQPPVRNTRDKNEPECYNIEVLL